MTTEKSARIAFGSALALLLCSSAVAGLIIGSLVESEKLVRHSYAVEVELEGVGAGLSNAGRARMFFVGSGNDADLMDYERAAKESRRRVDELRALTSDNPDQIVLWNKLSDIANRRLGVLRTSIGLRQEGKSTAQAQEDLTGQIAQAAFETTNTSAQMMTIEQSLLNQRSKQSDHLFTIMLCILFAVLAASLFLFWLHYRLLNRELLRRREAERSAQKVSARLLRLQDEERRRFSRELHDSLGQNLVAAKLIASGLPAAASQSAAGTQLLDVLEQCLTETRTLSHLLHPPLLDEIGLVSAARSLVQGFAKHASVEMVADIPEQQTRLPRPVELVLFRVLQEALTNVHRHSGSGKTEVSLTQRENRVTLTVKDHGRGIPADTLERFLAGGPHEGVGLVGMLERTRELGGNMSIDSNEDGTLLTVTIPLHQDAVSMATLEDAPATGFQRAPLHSAGG